MRCGKFREDLFYRLNVLRLNLPPLRKHPEDIEELADSFLSWLPQSLSLPRPQISPEALAVLKLYHFPGNIRELRNVIERLVVIAKGREIRESDISRVLLMNEAPCVAFRTCRCEQTNQAEYASCPDKQHHPSGTGGNTGQQGGNSPASGHLPRHVMEEAEGDRRTS